MIPRYRAWHHTVCLELRRWVSWRLRGGTSLPLVELQGLAVHAVTLVRGVWKAL